MLSLNVLKIAVKPTVAKPAGAGWGSLDCLQLSLLENR